MGLRLITPPDRTPVTLEEVKAQLSVEDNDWDDSLTLMIEAATGFLDGPQGDLCGRALMPQTWDYFLDSFPSDGIRLPLPPLIEVESINYVDSDTEMETVLSTSEYEVDPHGTPFHAWIAPANGTWSVTPFSTVNAVRVRFIAGYPDTGSSPAETTVPMQLRQAIILHVADMFGKGSAFVDRTQTPSAQAIEALTRHYVVRSV